MAALDAHQLLTATLEASSLWRNAFNSQNAAGCAAQYQSDAVMHARPFGTFEGTEQITAFWQQLIDQGFSDVNYIEPKLEVISDSEVLLTSKWRMNNASGVIHKEIWSLQQDGSMKLSHDDFEALGN